MSPTRRARTARTVILVLLALASVALLIVAKSLRQDVESLTDQVAEQRDLSLAGRRSRINFQAKQTFLLCSRKPALVSVEIAPDVRRACAGYRTLVQAERTEAALSPIPK